MFSMLFVDLDTNNVVHGSIAVCSTKNVFQYFRIIFEIVHVKTFFHHSIFVLACVVIYDIKSDHTNLTLENKSCRSVILTTLMDIIWSTG